MSVELKYETQPRQPIALGVLSPPNLRDVKSFQNFGKQTRSKLTHQILICNLFYSLRQNARKAALLKKRHL